MRDGSVGLDGALLFDSSCHTFHYGTRMGPCVARHLLAHSTKLPIRIARVTSRRKMLHSIKIYTFHSFLRSIYLFRYYHV